jgi:very-short-patch-repair endonuclease
VYAVGHTDISAEGRCLAGVLACGPDALLSHASAGWLWGLLRHRPEVVEVTAPVRRAPRPPLRLHSARGLAAEDRALIAGIPGTAIPRTLLDLAAILRADRLERALSQAEERRLLDLGPLEDLLGRTSGHPGRGRLRRALDLYRPPPFSRSGLERRFLRLVDAAGLPRPRTGYNVAGYELDAYWPAERFAVELDVYETHGGRASFEADRIRQEDLKLAGVEMTRVTGPRLDRDPQRVLERVARLLAQRRSQLRGGEVF